MAIKRRMTRDGLDMRYSLLSAKKDKIVANQLCGRVWQWKYKMQVDFPVGADYFSEEVTLQPAFQGIADMIYDRSVLQGVSSISK